MQDRTTVPPLLTPSNSSAGGSSPGTAGGASSSHSGLRSAMVAPQGNRPQNAQPEFDPDELFHKLDVTTRQHYLANFSTNVDEILAEVLPPNLDPRALATTQLVQNCKKRISDQTKTWKYRSFVAATEWFKKWLLCSPNNEKYRDTKSFQEICRAMNADFQMAAVKDVFRWFHKHIDVSEADLQGKRWVRCKFCTSKSPGIN